MRYAITPPDRVHLSIRGSDEIYPVRRVYCVGRNYAAHAIEMGHDPDREDPFFFLKCPENIVTGGADFPYPTCSSDVHHEIETVVALGTGGRDIAVENALDHVFGYGIGLDMTRRDLQGEVKKQGRPWEIGKAFDHSAPMSGLVRTSEVGHPDSGAIWLKVNGEVRQSANTKDLIIDVPGLIEFASSFYTLLPGDILMTGTPEGVGPVHPGDTIEAKIDQIGEMSVGVFAA